MLRMCMTALIVLAVSLSSLAQTTRPATQTADTSVKLQLGEPKSFPGGKVVKYSNVPYARVNDKGILLDIYKPAGVAKALPCVVWIHGGGWSAGNKDSCPAVLMVLKDYVVVSINYRLSQEAAFPAQIYDCKGAIRFLRAHAAELKIDPDRIGVWGASAGGHLVALLGTSGGVKELEGDIGGNTNQSSRVQAVCDWYGPADFLQFAKLGPAADAIKAITQLFGGPLSEHMDLARQASPVTHASKDTPPFLIMHGDKDKLVPLRQSELLEKALKDAKADVQLQVIKDKGHGDLGKGSVKTVGDFFDKHLKQIATSQPSTQPVR